MSSNSIILIPRAVVDPSMPPLGVPYGTFTDGGFYTGNIIIDGNMYAILVSPRAGGESGRLNFKPTATTDGANAASLNDGWKNTNLMNDAAHPACQWARQQVINGYNDWYIGSRDEMELIHRNLSSHAKATDNNAISTRSAQAGDISNANGQNSNSYPVGAAYTAKDPGIGQSVDFQYNGAEALYVLNGPQYYWTTSEVSSAPTTMWYHGSVNGLQATAGKGSNSYVRLIRRKLIGPAP